MSLLPRVLIADDHKVVVDGLVRLLRENYEIVGTINDGSLVPDAVSRLRPDVVILDISMPNMSGIEVAQRIKQRDSTIRIVFVTLHEDSDFQTAAFATGAEGYVTKARMAGDLLFAVREVLAGRRFCHST